MKNIFHTLSSLAILIALASSCTGKKDTQETDGQTYELFAYVWSGGDILPEPNSVTGINYAFACPGTDSIHIQNPGRLRNVLSLKDRNPDLKVFLSFGENSGAFSKIAASDSLRKAFAAACLATVEEYSLDGLDFDWEFPGDANGTPNDADNFVLLVKDIRETVGDRCMLSIAGSAEAGGLKLKELDPYIDFFNIMAYDMGLVAPWHHTALHRSELTGKQCVDEAVAAFADGGISPDKMILGMAFYGHGDGVNIPKWLNYDNIPSGEGMFSRWDSVACVPYIADSTGNLLVTYDNPRSLKIKCDYIKEKGLRGGMYWRAENDNDSLTLAKTVASNLIER